MLTVCRCSTRKEYRRFAELDPCRELLLSSDEAVRIARMRRFPCLMTMRDGRAVNRLMLLPNGEEAWFALLSVEDDAQSASLLFDEAARIAREWGCKYMRGPCLPDCSGFGLGVRLPESTRDESPWHPASHVWTAGRLEEYGFFREHILLSMEKTLAPGENPFAGAEQWAAKRGYTVQELPLSDTRTCMRAYSCSPDTYMAGFDSFARVCARLHGAKARFVLKDGRDIGWALLAGNRILHIQVLPEYRHSPAAAALLDSIARQGGTVCASTIDSENKSSLLMAEHAGMQIVGRYALYFRHITEK